MIRHHQKVSEILLDDDFINYVFDPTPDLREKWESFFRLHPEMISMAEKAKSILNNDSQTQLSTDEVAEMEQNILSACGLNQAN
jgi:hypothetical protein